MIPFIPRHAVGLYKIGKLWSKLENILKYSKLIIFITNIIYTSCIFEPAWSVSSVTHRRFSEPIIISPICCNRNMYVIDLIRRRICLPIYLKVFCFTKIILTETTWEKTSTFIALVMLIILFKKRKNPYHGRLAPELISCP